MRKTYDFTEARRNPYANRLKKQVTIRLDIPTLDYFKELSEELGIPYQTLINHYLQECAASGKRPSMTWRSDSRQRTARST
jgi:predicted DNA binding CopG/RHH family protein